MKTVIIKYNAGNVASVQFALSRLGVDAVISASAEEISTADRVIFPGVGEASSAMRSLKADQLDAVIRDLRQPTLGICLGMQLLCASSEEGNTQGLGIFPAVVRKFDASGDRTMKIPHMGWNNLRDNRGRLYTGISQEQYVYYVHGYCADICDDTTAVTDYIRPFSASLERNNFFGVQFHPEKSGSTGERIIKNFLEL